MKFIDITGQRFGKLLVIKFTHMDKYAMWQCKCDCGTVIICRGTALRGNYTKSCGCVRYEKSIKHNQYKSVEYKLFNHAKKRAKRKNLEFNIELSDIIIPESCPILKIKLNQLSLDNTPTIDRIDSSKGYLKDNIKIISYKANVRKSNGTLDEYKSILNYMNKHKR